MAKTTNKQTSSKVSTIAAKVLSTGKATKKELLTLAGSALVQDQTKGNKNK